MKKKDPRQRASDTKHDLRLLRRRLKECQYYISKCDRPTYGQELLRLSGLAVAWYIRAWEEFDQSRKYEAVCQSAMWFAVLREDIEEAFECNVIKFPKRKPKSDNPVLAAAEEVSGRKLEIVELIAKIDEGLGRWRSSLSQGQARTRSATDTSPLQECGS